MLTRVALVPPERLLWVITDANVECGSVCRFALALRTALRRHHIGSDVTNSPCAIARPLFPSTLFLSRHCCERCQLTGQHQGGPAVPNSLLLKRILAEICEPSADVSGGHPPGVLLRQSQFIYLSG